MISRNIFFNLEEFLDKIFLELNELKINVDGLFLDHIAYRTKTEKQYEAAKKAIKKKGNLITENIIRNRPIAVYKLFESIDYNSRQINCAEIIAPAEGDYYACGGNMWNLSLKKIWKHL